MAEQKQLGNDGLVVRDSGLWIKDKLHYLGRYLKILSVGMKNKWGGRLYYVDLFAGPGRCRIRETQKEIDGSPLIALLGFNFARYFFFELNSSCCAALDTRAKKRAPNKYTNVRIIPGDCNETIGQVELPSSSLGLALIDPTGISQISFKAVQQLTANRQIDLIINFPEGMGIRLNLHQYTQSETNALNRFMGSARWRQRYRQSLTSLDKACREIAAEYSDNLRALGYLSIESDWIPVRTNQNMLLYYLMFASKHPKGNEFWRKIRLIDPYGQRMLPGV